MGPLLNIMVHRSLEFRAAECSRSDGRRNSAILLVTQHCIRKTIRLLRRSVSPSLGSACKILSSILARA
jgi:hypothetical protein